MMNTERSELPMHETRPCAFTHRLVSVASISLHHDLRIPQLQGQGGKDKTAVDFTWRPREIWIRRGIGGDLEEGQLRLEDLEAGRVLGLGDADEGLESRLELEGKTLARAYGTFMILSHEG